MMLPFERFLAVLMLAIIAGWLIAILLQAALNRFGPAVARPGIGLWRQAWSRPGARLRQWAPGLTGFLERRFDPHRGDGLIVTLIVIAAVYAASLIFGLIEDLLDVHELAAFDKDVFAFSARWQTPQSLAVFRWITQLGGIQTLLAVVVVASGFILVHGPRQFLLPMWIAVAGSQATTWLGKFALNRARPEFLFDVTAESPSFPSGHAANALAVYGIVGYILARDLPPGRRLHVWYWVAAGVSLIALSRVVLHVHYPSDVAAGLLVGTFWLLMAVAVAERRRAREETLNLPV